MPNTLIIFDLTGSYAMFRKFYTNSSSLSYPFPPRSTLAGLIAGLMGYERDSYHEDLSLNYCRIAVAVKAPVRRVMQTVSYVRTKKEDGLPGFFGASERTQIPIEWLFPEIDIPKLHYRVYLTHEDTNWLAKLDDLLKHDAWIYPPYLGMTECLAEIHHVTTSHNWTLSVPKTVVSVATVIPTDALDGGPELIPDSQIIKERIPLALNHERKLEAICDVLYERTGKGIIAQLNREAFRVTYEVAGNTAEETGVFLE